MAPLPVDPASTFVTLIPRKIKKHKTSHSSGTLSKPAAIAIAVVVAILLIAAIIISIIMHRRKKARSRDKRSTVPGLYSTENRPGLYGETPAYQGDNSAYGKTGGDGYGGTHISSGGEGTDSYYYNDGQHSSGRNYGTVNHGIPQRMPQQLPMAYTPPARV